jgi:hypothetical protein
MSGFPVICAAACVTMSVPPLPASPRDNAGMGDERLTHRKFFRHVRLTFRIPPWRDHAITGLFGRRNGQEGQ